MVVRPPDEVNEGQGGIGAWIAVLCLLLLIWHPVSLALRTAQSLGALAYRGFPMAVVVVVQLLVTALGVAAGLALMERRRGAATLAIWALVLSGVVDLFVYSTSYLPSSRLPGSTPLYVLASLAYHATWIAYLAFSKRVRRTFGEPEL